VGQLAAKVGDEARLVERLVAHRAMLAVVEVERRRE